MEEEVDASIDTHLRRSSEFAQAVDFRNDQST
jgi:hypothetical protein